MSWSGAGRRVGAAHRRALIASWWPAWGVLALVVASEYKFRMRADDETVSGSADLLILVEVAVYAAVGCVLFLRYRPAPRLRRPDPVTFWLYGYVAVLAVAALYSPYRELAVVRAAQTIVVLGLCRSIALHSSRTALHRVAHGYSVLVAASVVFGVVAPFPRLPSQPDRFTWLYLHPVDAGQFLAIAVVVLLTYLLGHGLDRPGPRWSRAVYGVLLAICVAGLIGTNTRGAALGAVVGLVVIVCTRWKGIRRLEFVTVLALIGVAIALAAADLVEAFFARGESAERLASLNSRTDLWAYAFEAFGEHPLFGHGLAASRGLFLDAIGLGGGHNGLVNLLVDTGVVGAAVWVALVVRIVLGAVRGLRGDPRMILDRVLILSVPLSMTANSMFTEALGAPANVASVWLFLLAAWTSRSIAEGERLLPERAARPSPPDRSRSDHVQPNRPDGPSLDRTVRIRPHLP